MLVTTKISSVEATDVHIVLHGKHNIMYKYSCSKSFRRLPPGKSFRRVFTVSSHITSRSPTAATASVV